MLCPTPDLTRSPQQLSPEEQKAIIAAHANSEQTQASGIRLAGQKYFTLLVDSRSIYGKKQVCGVSAQTGCWRANGIMVYIGRWLRDREDKASYPCHSLQSPNSAVRSYHRRRRPCRLPHQRQLLDCTWEGTDCEIMDITKLYSSMPHLLVEYK